MLSSLGAGRVLRGAGQAHSFSCVTTALFLKDKQHEQHRTRTVAASSSSKPHKELTLSPCQALQVPQKCEVTVSPGTRGRDCSEDLIMTFYPVSTAGFEGLWLSSQISKCPSFLPPSLKFLPAPVCWARNPTMS